MLLPYDIPHTTTNSLSLRSLLISQHVASYQANPHMQAAVAQVEEFAKTNHVLLANYRQTCTIGGFLYPQASLERLVVLTEFMCSAFYLDDVFGDLPTSQGLSPEKPPTEVMDMLNACIQAFKEGNLSPDHDVIAFAFREVREHMAALSPAWWLERFTPPMVNYLISTVEPSAFGWQADGSITARDFIDMREHISGMYPTVDLIEFAIDGYLPDEVFHHPRIQRLRRACSRVCSLTNDLFSYHREVMVQGLRLNLVDVIQRNQDVSLADAVEQTIEIINEETCLFYEDAARCALWDDPTNQLVERYIDGMKSQLNATWHWEMYTNRYRSPESPFVELQQLL